MSGEMKWWRAYHGLPFDSKLAVVARRANSGRADVLAVWVACLDYASQNKNRGSIDGIDPEEIGVGLDLDPEKVAQIVGVFREKGMIDEGDRLEAWERRQPLREREGNSTERVREFRRRQATPNSGEGTVTPSNATERHGAQGNAQIREEEIREQEIKEEKKTRTQGAVRASQCVTDLNAQTSAKFEEFWEKYPRKKRKPMASLQFRSVVTVENEAAMFACLDRYLASGEVARGAVMNPHRWLSEQYQEDWAGDWPRPKLLAFDRAIAGGEARRANLKVYVPPT